MQTPKPFKKTKAPKPKQIRLRSKHSLNPENQALDYDKELLNLNKKTRKKGFFKKKDTLSSDVMAEPTKKGLFRKKDTLSSDVIAKPKKKGLFRKKDTLSSDVFTTPDNENIILSDAVVRPKKKLFFNKKKTKSPVAKAPKVKKPFFAFQKNKNSTPVYQITLNNSSDFIMAKPVITDNVYKPDLPTQDFQDNSSSGMRTKEHFAELEANTQAIINSHNEIKSKKKSSKKKEKSEKKNLEASKKTIKTKFISSAPTITTEINNDTLLPEEGINIKELYQHSWLHKLLSKIFEKPKTLFRQLKNNISQKGITDESIWATGIVVICVIVFIGICSATQNSTGFSVLSDKMFLLPETEVHIADMDDSYMDEDMDFEEDYYEDEEYYDEEFEDEYYEDDEFYDEEFEDEEFEDEEYLDEEDSDIEEEEYVSPIDFEYLSQTDSDIYAWIYIPGTAIDYPIIQNGIDDYSSLNYKDIYVETNETTNNNTNTTGNSSNNNTNTTGSSSNSNTNNSTNNTGSSTTNNNTTTEEFKGLIYTEEKTSTDFSDNNTVIYGHNLKNGTAFSDLEKFKDANFFKEFDTIYIYTPEAEFTYTVFAAYPFKDIDILNSFDFSNDKIYEEYLKSVLTLTKSYANLRTDVSVTSSDRIITLITCDSNDASKRYYVQAVLTGDYTFDSEFNDNDDYYGDDDDYYDDDDDYYDDDDDYYDDDDDYYDDDDPIL